MAELAESLGQACPAFSSKGFLDQVYDHKWPGLELTQRMTHISQALRFTLSADYESSIGILKKVATRFTGFDAMVFPDFVGQFGLDSWDTSMDALEEFTQSSSGEFAIRQFILKNSKKTMQRMLQWSKHSNHHVRRLSSEGCRPRLPWSVALPEFKKDPNPIFPILENLKSDESEYVRKSVANNLNDITKDNSDLVLKRMQVWNNSPTKETRWIIQHSLRSLIKQGNPKAMGLLGYGTTKVDISNLRLESSIVQLGGSLNFSFKLTNRDNKPIALLVDYRVHFMKSNGKTAPKVFKLTQCVLEGSSERNISKTHLIKPITTRKYYPGKHQVEIQVNGQIEAEASFYLEL